MTASLEDEQRIRSALRGVDINRVITRVQKLIDEARKRTYDEWLALYALEVLRAMASGNTDAPMSEAAHKTVDFVLAEAKKRMTDRMRAALENPEAPTTL